MRSHRNLEKGRGGYRNLSWKDFKMQYPEKYEDILKKSRRTAVRTFKKFANLDIRIRVPSTLKHSTKDEQYKAELIARYAKAILRLYKLEPADAFHIAVARCEGSEFIVSNDAGFQKVDNICIYSRLKSHSK